MELRIERKLATGWAAHERYRQVLVDPSGHEHWSCIVINCSERSELEAEKDKQGGIGSQQAEQHEGPAQTEQLRLVHHLYP